MDTNDCVSRTFRVATLTNVIIYHYKSFSSSYFCEHGYKHFTDAVLFIIIIFYKYRKCFITLKSMHCLRKLLWRFLTSL